MNPYRILFEEETNQKITHIYIVSIFPPNENIELSEIDIIDVTDSVKQFLESQSNPLPIKNEKIILNIWIIQSIHKMAEDISYEILERLKLIEQKIEILRVKDEENFGNVLNTLTGYMDSHFDAL